MRTCASLLAAITLLAFPSMLISSMVRVIVMAVSSFLVSMDKAPPSFLSIASK